MDVILGHLTPKQLQTHCTQALTAELKSCEDQLRLTLDAIQRLVSVRQAAAKLDVQGLDAKLKARVVRIDKLHKDVSAGINALMQDAGLAAASDAVQSTAAARRQPTARVIIDCSSPTSSPTRVSMFEESKTDSLNSDAEDNLSKPTPKTTTPTTPAPQAANNNIKADEAAPKKNNSAKATKPASKKKMKAAKSKKPASQPQSKKKTTVCAPAKKKAKGATVKSE